MFPIFKRIGPYRGEPLYQASPDSAEYRVLLHNNGFGTVWLAQFNDDGR
jgi:hypothetical protein